METEIVGWLADREEAIRAYAKTLPCRRQRTKAVVNCGGDDDSRLHRGTGFLSWWSEPQYCNKSTTSAEIFAARLCDAFAALLEKKIFENEPPLFAPLMDHRNSGTLAGDKMLKALPEPGRPCMMRHNSGSRTELPGILAYANRHKATGTGLVRVWPQARLSKLMVVRRIVRTHKSTVIIFRPLVNSL
jgi:hypothetical protein